MTRPKSEPTARRWGTLQSSTLTRRSAARKRELAAEAKAQRSLGHVSCEQVRYRERSTVERVNGRLKDDFGGRQVRVRGHAKVLCHLNVRHSCKLTVAQLVRLLALKPT